MTAHTTKTAILAAAMALGLAGAATAQTIRLAMNNVEDIETNPEQAFVEAFRDRLDSEGITVQVFPSDSLGTEAERLSQTTQNLIQVNLATTTTPAGMSPLLRVNQVPFLFESAAQFNRMVEETEFLDRINDPLLPQGVRVVGYTPAGIEAGFFFTETLVSTLEEFRTQRMRALDRAQVAFYEAFGVKATIVDWTEVANAFQTGVVDGYVNPPAMAIRTGHTDILRHFTPGRLAPSFRIVLLSEDWYAGLDDDTRAAVDEAVEAGLQASRDWVDNWADQVQARFDEAGVTVTELAPGEREKMVDIASQIHKVVLGEDGYALITGLLDQVGN